MSKKVYKLISQQKQELYWEHGMKSGQYGSCCDDQYFGTTQVIEM